jgi:hypothetical protein
MRARTLITVLLVSTATLAACSSDNTLGLGVAGSSNGADTLNNARIRVVNATATSLDVATNGTVSAGNGALGFGTSSSCISVVAANPSLTIRLAGTTTTVPGFTPAFLSGVDFTVIAYPGAGGVTQFVTVSNTFTPAADQAAMRVFNAAAAVTSFDVYVTTPGISLATSVASANSVSSGTGSFYFNVPGGTTQQIRVTPAGSSTLLLDVGNVTLDAGKTVTLVIAPPVSGSTVLRAFLVAGC